jgi:phosphatidylserine synthase
LGGLHFDGRAIDGLDGVVARATNASIDRGLTSIRKL